MKITNEVIENHGLKPDEYLKIKKLIKREPNLLELGIFSAMWNEHCSYKSSRIHLKIFQQNKKCYTRTGENAGVIDIGDNDEIIFKMKSQSPSFIEPYLLVPEVGGILRDVFTGSKTNCFVKLYSFWDIKRKNKKSLNEKFQALADELYWDTTVAGETKFNSTYNENILVNAMAVGHANKDKIFTRKQRDRQICCICWSKGRDGPWSSMASAEFDESSEEKPTVQVGDPFTEKLLMEACLELMKDNSIISIQDMGALV